MKMCYGDFQASEVMMEHKDESDHILTPEERAAFIQKIREKIESLEDWEMQNLYIILKRLGLFDE